MKLPKYASALFFISILWNISCYAQDTLVGNKDLFKPVHHVGMTNALPVFPKFPGGKDSLAAFLKAHTHYPKLAKAHNISCKVEVYFTVFIDGSIQYARVINRKGYGCDEEAIRVVNLMPKWEPAMQGNTPIQLDCHVTVPFEKPTNN
jgi:protein TonB